MASPVQSARRMAIPSTIRPTRSATGTPMARNSVSHFAPLGDGGPRRVSGPPPMHATRSVRPSLRRSSAAHWLARTIGCRKTKLAMQAVPSATRRVRPATSERKTMASTRGFETRLSPVKTASKSSEASAASHIATRSFGLPAPMTTPRFGTLRPKRTGIGWARPGVPAGSPGLAIVGAAGEALPDPRLRRGQPGSRYEVGGAGDVVHADLVTELDRRRLAAVLPADPDLEVGTPATAAVDPERDQLAHALLIEDRERVRRHKPHVEVLRQELRDVVPAVAERELGEVVRPEREELGVVGDLLGDEGRPRDLDHRADDVRHGRPHLGEDPVGHPPGLLERLLHLADGPGERDHDLRLHADALLGDGAGRLHDRPHLHPVDLRVRDAEPAAAVPEHRVRLAKPLHSGDDGVQPPPLLGLDPERFETALLRYHLLVFLPVRQELVERRVEEPDGHGEA